MSERYINYLDTDVRRIGHAESLRGMTRLKHVSTVQTGVTLSGEGDSAGPEWPYLRVANVQVGYVDLREIKTVRVPSDRAAASMLQPGDVLMTEGGDIDKLGRGAVWRGEVPNILHQNHIFAVRPNEALDSEFLVYWLDGPVARTYFRTTAKQTTNLAGTNKWTLGNLPVPAPPLEEQRAIADYLDRETARIDTLIEEQQRLIEMLRERRQAVIEHATATGGVTPPSGWGVATLRRIGRFITGTTPTGTPEDVFGADGQLGWARPEDLGDRVNPSRRLSASGAEQVRPTHDAVLVCCIGATVGKVGWADGLISSNQQITAIEVDGSVKYWYYALTGSRSALVALAVGNTIPILNNMRLGELKVTVPPIADQHKIAAYLDEQTVKINALIAETERFIELARERRAALITAAVTGQIDVREMA